MALTDEEIEYALNELRRQITDLTNIISKLTAKQTVNMLSAVTEHEIALLAEKINLLEDRIENIESRL
jgi:hypothetical protein